MALTPGTRLGVYEVTAQIGEGGMGQVYRARDTKLDRDVAIKILPEAFAHDTDRLARFQREAKTLAALNHPNIAAIYGLEDADGITALVMELVEGDDLSQLIARRSGGPEGPPLHHVRSGGSSAFAEATADRRSLGGGWSDPPTGMPLDEVLPIARQIAEALEAAHEQGIIHRDLKPANIKVRPDGVVKVLDFGLAKLADVGRGFSPAGDAVPEGPASVPRSQMPTITSPAMMTGVGMILGTVAYMSPEQARGRTVDRRTDVWAFGAVLFEMLTGTRAFAGDGVSDVLASVLAREPDWTRLPASLSSALGTCIRRCLHKDPKQRFGDMQSVRLVLEGVFETAAPQMVAAASPSSSRGRLVWTTALAAVAVLAAVSLAIPAVRYLQEAAPAETRVEIVTPGNDQSSDFALSPDGRQILFVASGDGMPRLWLRSLARTTPEPLAGTEGARLPFWSPDGRSIGFFAGNALKRLDLGGSAAQALAVLTSGTVAAGGGTWNVDGVILFNPRGRIGPLQRMSATGGATAAVTTLGPQQQGHFAPSFLPDGRRFLFYVRGVPDAAGIYLGALDGRVPTRLTAASGAGVYLPSGWLLWVRAGTQTLVAQRLDVDGAALTGEPVTVADGVAVDAVFNRSALSATATGLVAYRTGAGLRRQLTWVDRSGEVLGTVGDPDAALNFPRVSPDGRRVVVSRSVQGNQNLWLLDGTRATRFTFDAATDWWPLWSPDGARIAFSSNRTSQFDLYQKLASGADVEEPLVASDQLKAPLSWSADGRFLLYRSVDPQTNNDLWVMPMTVDSAPSVFLKTPFNETQATFSPDHRWVAYQSDESGRDEIYVRPLVLPDAVGSSKAETEGRWQVSTAGGVFPAWRPDGKELYYLNPAGAMMVAQVTVTRGGLTPGTPAVLFSTRIVDATAPGTGREYSVSADGRFLINAVLDSASAPITLIQNWQGGLSAREK